MFRVFVRRFATGAYAARCLDMPPCLSMFAVMPDAAQPLAMRFSLAIT
jgi:hypothetical protein